jgi:hypothetical protein
MQERAPIYRDALREEHRDAARSNNVNTNLFRISVESVGADMISTLLVK